MKIGRLDFLKGLAVLAGAGGAVTVCAKSVAAKPAPIKAKELTIENLREAVRIMEKHKPRYLIVQPRHEDVAGRLLAEAWRERK